MRQIKRWTSSVAASFDWVINQVENHDAVVSAAIKEMQDSAVKAKIQLRRVQEDGKRLTKRKQEADRGIENWNERALNLKETDKEKALECLRRRKQCKKEAEYFEEEQKKHLVFETQMKKDLDSVISRIEELHRKKNSMKARAIRQDAIKASEDTGIELVSEIDELFERWEIKVAQTEILGEPCDNFEKEFEDQEELLSLEQELEELGGKK